MIEIWACDPGKCSGWAHLTVENGEVSFFLAGQTDHFELGDMLRNSKWMDTMETVFICESYKQNCKMTQAPWSLETIGLVRYWAHYYSIEFYLVNPSEHKSLIKDEVIKRAGLWIPGLPHGMDAIRVGLYWLIKERRLLTSCLKLEQN